MFPARSRRFGAARGHSDSLTIDFPEPVDHVLSSRASKPWTGAYYSIEIDSDLEDLAGNNMHHLFDVMPGHTAARGTKASVVRLGFTPK
jgi:hypothetical protein